MTGEQFALPPAVVDMCTQYRTIRDAAHAGLMSSATAAQLVGELAVHTGTHTWVIDPATEEPVRLGPAEHTETPPTPAHPTQPGHPQPRHVENAGLPPATSHLRDTPTAGDTSIDLDAYVYSPAGPVGRSGADYLSETTPPEQPAALETPARTAHTPPAPFAVPPTVSFTPKPDWEPVTPSTPPPPAPADETVWPTTHPGTRTSARQFDDTTGAVHLQQKPQPRTPFPSPSAATSAQAPDTVMPAPAVHIPHHDTAEQLGGISAWNDRARTTTDTRRNPRADSTSTSPAPSHFTPTLRRRTQRQLAGLALLIVINIVLGATLPHLNTDTATSPDATATHSADPSIPTHSTDPGIPVPATASPETHASGSQQVNP